MAAYKILLALALVPSCALADETWCDRSDLVRVPLDYRVDVESTLTIAEFSTDHVLRIRADEFIPANRFDFTLVITRADGTEILHEVKSKSTYIGEGMTFVARVIDRKADQHLTILTADICVER